MARARAAGALEANPADLVFDVEPQRVRGGRATRTRRCRWPGSRRTSGCWCARCSPHPAPTFPFGAHVAVVEVDTETGKVVLRRMVTVDDAGIVLNPLLAEGQRHGGIAQGAAQALLEEVVYDADGNPLTASFADYPFLSATEVPSFELVDMATPTTLQPARRQGNRRGGHDRLDARPCRTPSSTPSPTSASGTSTCPPRRSGSGGHSSGPGIRERKRHDAGRAHRQRRAAVRRRRAAAAARALPARDAAACGPPTSAATPPRAAPARCC